MAILENEEYPIPFFAFKTSLAASAVCLGSLATEELSWLNVSKDYRSMHDRFHPDTSVKSPISLNTNELVPLVDMHFCVIILPPTCLSHDVVLWIPSCSFPSPYFPFCIILKHFFFICFNLPKKKIWFQNEAGLHQSKSNLPFLFLNITSDLQFVNSIYLNTVNCIYIHEGFCWL